jgi:hypothetical protein
MNESGSPADDAAQANDARVLEQLDRLALEARRPPGQRRILEPAYQQRLPPLSDFNQFQDPNVGRAPPDVGRPVSRYFPPHGDYVPGPHPSYPGLPVLQQDTGGRNADYRGMTFPPHWLPPDVSGHYMEEYPPLRVPGGNMAPPPAPFPTHHHELLPPFQPLPGLNMQQTEGFGPPQPIPPPPRDFHGFADPGLNLHPLAPDMRNTAPAYPPPIGPPPDLHRGYMTPPPARLPTHHELLPPFQSPQGLNIQQTEGFGPPLLPPPPRDFNPRDFPGFVDPASNLHPLAVDMRNTAPVYPAPIGPPPGLQSGLHLTPRTPQSAGHRREMPYIIERDTRPRWTAPRFNHPGNIPPWETPLRGNPQVETLSAFRPKGSSDAWLHPPKSIYTKARVPPKSTPRRRRKGKKNPLDISHFPPLDPHIDSIFCFTSGTPVTRPPLTPGEYPASFRPSHLPSPISPPHPSPRPRLDPWFAAPESPRALPSVQLVYERLGSSHRALASDIEEVRDPLPEAVKDEPEETQPVEGDSSGALPSDSHRNPDEETENREETDKTPCDEAASRAGTCCKLHAQLKMVLPRQMSNKNRNNW